MRRDKEKEEKEEGEEASTEVLNLAEGLGELRALPNEVLIRVLSYLNLKELKETKTLSKYFNEFIKNLDGTNFMSDLEERDTKTKLAMAKLKSIREKLKEGADALAEGKTTQGYMLFLYSMYKVAGNISKDSKIEQEARREAEVVQRGLAALYKLSVGNDISKYVPPKE
jgi:hypothetical protein